MPMIFLFLSSSEMRLKNHWLDMPYIKQAQREELDWRIRNLAQAIRELSDVDKPASFCRTLELNLHKTGVALIPQRHYWAIALSSRSNRMEMFTIIFALAESLVVGQAAAPELEQFSPKSAPYPPGSSCAADWSFPRPSFGIPRQLVYTVKTLCMAQQQCRDGDGKPA
jgi:hypothetical protein